MHADWNLLTDGNDDSSCLQAPLGGLPAVSFAADASPLGASGRDSTAGGSPTASSSPRAQRGARGFSGGTAGAASPAAAKTAQQPAAAPGERTAGSGGATAAMHLSGSLQQAARQAVGGINAQVRPHAIRF